MKTKLSTTLLFLLFTQTLLASNISFEQVSKDIHILADDKMEGRKVFGAGVDKAAKYIAQRFQDIGLKPLKNEKNFLQTFEIFQVTPQQYQVMIDGQSLSEENILAFTTYENLDWTLDKKIKLKVISADTDIRQSLAQVNQETDNLLVLVNSAHAAMFQRLKKHFSKGLTKFKVNQGPSAVFLLTDKEQLNAASISIKTSIEAKKLTNVVGVLPGKELTDEYVLFSAHYDHVGIDENLDGDQIFNGADDDASGTTAVLNLAQYLAKKNAHQRSLIFTAFTAEEIGGFGSQYFSAQVNPDSIAAMINIEMIGKPSKFGHGKLWMTGYERSNLAELLNNNLKDAQIYPDPYPKYNLFYRSDNATLARLGVPAHSFSSSQIDIDKHYHQVSDDVSTLDIQSMHQVIESLAEAVDGLVKGTDTPTRVDTSQVKKSGTFY